MKKYSTLLIIVLSYLVSSAQFTWLNKNAFPGTPRRMAAGFEINGNGYIIGGNTSTLPSEYINDVWEYNASADSWTQKSNFPFSGGTAAYFVINGVGYVVGGGDSSSYYHSSNYAYNSTSDTWTAKANFPENGVSGAFQFVINGIAYVGTGARNGSNNSSTVYAYDPVADGWSQRANYPGPQSINMAGFVIDSFGYAGLGQDGAGSFYNQFYKYTPSTNSWATIAPFPGKPRSATAYFVLDGIAYVGGGVREIGSLPFALADYYAYDPVTNTWSPSPGFPGAPRQYAVGIVINDNAYAIGGYENDGDDFYNLVSEFGSCSQLSGILPVTPNSNNPIQLFPNPTNGDLHVKVSGQSSKLQYEVIAVDGQVAISGTSVQSDFNLETNHLAAGVYILNVKNADGLLAFKRFEVLH